MVRLFLSIFFVVSLLNVVSPFGASIAHFLNIRCTFSDSFLSSAFKLYDEMIASSMITFYYHSRNDGELKKISRINGSYCIGEFDRLKQTKLVIHGFWNSHNSKINKALIEAYSSHHNVNLIIVNYSGISRDDCYKIVRRRVLMLGRRIATFLDDILTYEPLHWESLTLIGHSLGSHIAGGESILNFKLIIRVNM